MNNIDKHRMLPRNYKESYSPGTDCKKRKETAGLSFYLIFLSLLELNQTEAIEKNKKRIKKKN